MIDDLNMWDQIISEKDFGAVGISGFKDNGFNDKISLYNYRTHGLFFLKNIIYNMTKRFNKSDLSLLDGVKHSLGGGAIYKILWI